MWRQTLPGYVVKPCYWRDLAGMRQRGRPPAPVAPLPDAAGQRVLQCLVTDGLSRFSVFIGPYQASQPASPQGRPVEGSMRVASRSYGSAYQLTAVGAVPQAALQQAVDALYRP